MGDHYVDLEAVKKARLCKAGGFQVEVTRNDVGEVDFPEKDSNLSKSDRMITCFIWPEVYRNDDHLDHLAVDDDWGPIKSIPWDSVIGMASASREGVAHVFLAGNKSASQTVSVLSMVPSPGPGP